jgi:hypothetical protein
MCVTDAGTELAIVGILNSTQALRNLGRRPEIEVTMA